MINVSEINKPKDLNLNKTKKATGGGDFSAYLKESMSGQPQGVSGTTSIAVPDAIFAAQMVDGEEEREAKKRLLKRGNTLLEKLEEIRDGLLAGVISKEKLIEISRLVKDKKFHSEDPRLTEIIGEIELRVEVELAKLTK